MMMLPATLLAVLVGCCHGVNYQGRTLECQAGRTRIQSRFTSETGRNCSELVAANIDHYHGAFVADCKRWMGEDHPDNVEDYFVLKCEEQEDGSIEYKGDICCYGEPPMRCFECLDFESAVTCRESAPAITCGEGQVCKTTVEYVGNYPNTKTIRSTGCADADVCTNEHNDNANTCTNWLVSPVCTYCCGDPFCNYYPPTGVELLVGDTPCLSEPCQNGATCLFEASPTADFTCVCAPGYTDSLCSTLVSDPCDDHPCLNEGVCETVETSYTCTCRIGWGGVNCQDPYPYCSDAENICENGGICYNHGTYGLRCKCPYDYLGSRCELPKVPCFTPMSYRVSSTRMMENTDCTTRLLKEQDVVDRENSIRWCIRFMQQPGRPMFDNNWDGEVERVESRSHHDCATGDQYTFVTTSWCCPTCFSMPCLNDGWCTQTEDGDYSCNCRYGWFGRNCELRRNMCLVSGDPHYETFDGALYHFQGNGSFELITTTRKAPEQFSIASSNERVGQFSYLLSMTVTACDRVVVLERDYRVTVDGRSVDPASYLQFDCIRILMNGDQVRLQTTFGLIVEFDGKHTGYIQLDTSFMNEVEGLCGNFDGDSETDFIARDGTDYRNSEHRDYHVGIGWELDGDNGAQPDPVLDCASIADDIDTIYCAPLLGLNGVFAECMEDETIDSQTEVEFCQYDVCALSPDTNAMEDAACEAMEAFALKCESAGYVLPWRAATGCHLTCREGFVYCELAPACPATCRVPDAASTCEQPDKEACVCPDGTLLNKGQCIDPSECGCVDEFGNQFQIGETWLSALCDTLYTCMPCDTCELPIGKIVGATFTCQEGTLCSASTPGISTCVEYTDPCLEVNCKNDGECVSSGFKYVCKCRAGYYGKNCGGNRAPCPAGTDYCKNGGECFDHGKHGLRCRCPDGFVGTQCELPVLTCHNSASYRIGASSVKRSVDCTEQIQHFGKKLYDVGGVRWCKNFMRRKDGPLFEDGVHGRVQDVESRGLHTCDMGELYTFYTRNWCCPTCFSVPCLNGGFCTQKNDGDYECACAEGWTGLNCDIATPVDPVV